MENKHINNNSGFTLLEIIIVMIIIGVIASLALPRLIASVELSRGQEALETLIQIRRGMETCSAADNPAYNDFDGCTTLAGIGVDGAPVQAHFSYGNPVVVAAAQQYSVVATRNTREGGNGTDTITMTYNAGLTTRAGTTAFASIR